jgi:opacity protein-like surface antigen
VVGVEADAQFLGEQGSSNRRGGVTGTTLGTPASVGTPPFALFGSAPLVQLGPNTFTFFDPRAAQSEDPDWFGTVRLRLGYAFDRWLVYGTGGLAYSVGGRVDPTVNVTTHLGPLPRRTASAARTTTATTPVSDGPLALDSSTRSPTIGA